MQSNDFSFSLANRDWDLLAKEGVHQDLLSFEKVTILLNQTYSFCHLYLNYFPPIVFTGHDELGKKGRNNFKMAS